MDKFYIVTLSADAIVSASIRIRAGSAQEASSKALAMKEEDIKWTVDSLHDSVSECGVHSVKEI
jgi:hypothetical protein